MKYSEFERTVKSMGLFINDREGEIYVEDDSQFPVLTVSKLDEMVIDTEYPSFIELPYGKKDTLLILVVTLAKTPLAEREEEKKYRVKFPSITRWGDAVYLKKDTGDQDPIGVDWSSEDFIFYGKPIDYIFTEQEIKDIDERYLAFKVEVKDE